MTLIIAIDPGVSGGVAFLKGDDHHTFKMPLWKKGILKGEVSSAGIYDLILDAAAHSKGDVVYAYERQGTFGRSENKSPTTMLGMGGGYKSVRLAIQMAQDTIGGKILEPIMPISWKSKLGLRAPKGSTPKQRKEITEMFLLELFKGPDVYGAKGGYHDGRGDALAIAYFVKMTGGWE
jgi:hypothetical protein